MKTLFIALAVLFFAVSVSGADLRTTIVNRVQLETSGMVDTALAQVKVDKIIAEETDKEVAKLTVRSEPLRITSPKVSSVKLKVIAFELKNVPVATTSSWSNTEGGKTGIITRRTYRAVVK